MEKMRIGHNGNEIPMIYYECLPGVIVGYDKNEFSKKYWAIYHEPSMKRIGSINTDYKTKKDAIEAIKYITGKYNLKWDLPEEDLYKYVKDNEINSRDFNMELYQFAYRSWGR